MKEFLETQSRPEEETGELLVSDVFLLGLYRIGDLYYSAEYE